MVLPAYLINLFLIPFEYTSLETSFVVMVKCDLEQSENSDEATDLCETTCDQVGGYCRDHKGIVVVIVLEKDTHGFITEVVSSVIILIVRTSTLKLKLLVCLVSHTRHAELPQI